MFQNVVKRGRPQKCGSVKKGPGRPKCKEQMVAFETVVSKLESNHSKQWTLTEIQHMMSIALEEQGSSKIPCGTKTLKTWLLEYFEERITISSIDGKADVVMFTKQQDLIIRQFYKESREEDLEKEKLRLLKVARSLIMEDIACMENLYSTCFPSMQDFNADNAMLEFVPYSLCFFLSGMINSSNESRHIAAIGQAILQASRPRSLLAPLQFGLAVQVNHHFASRFLNDLLHSLGFACSYDVVQSFRKTVAITQGSEFSLLEPGTFGQYHVEFIADNVDHNQITIDGHNTLHAVGMMLTCTPAKTFVAQIERKRNVTAEDIKCAARIQIRQLPGPCFGLSHKVFPSLKPSQVMQVDGPQLLWSLSSLLEKDRPSWSGFMQAVHVGQHSGVASFHYLPIIDMDPTDRNCIYSTLWFIEEQSSRFNVTAAVTFDEPLFWKATQIQESEVSSSRLRNILVKLGGFHTMMNGLGAAGYIMAGSGYEELPEEIFAKNTIQHIMSGKSYDRALRASILTFAAINHLTAAAAFNVTPPLKSKEGNPDHLSESRSQMTTNHSATDDDLELLTQASSLFDDLSSGRLSPLQLSNATVIHKLYDKISTYEKSLTSRTANLWLQFKELILIILTFLKAERLGDFQLHLHSLRCMLPYLAVAGHNRYTKSVTLYLEKMHSLEETHPELYTTYLEHGHTVRRSDRLWGGLSLDLCIEQGMMKVIKSAGDLTRGRGVDELQRAIFLLSAHITGAYNEQMQELTGINMKSSDQHRDEFQSRLTRDKDDLMKIVDYLDQHNPLQHVPFCPNTLHNIATGKTASSAVNADSAQSVGESILQSMEGKIVTDFSFSKKSWVHNMASDSAVRIKVGKEDAGVDPNLLFQRFATAGLNAGDLNEIMKYELCTYPPALFEKSFVLRTTNKSTLVNALTNHNNVKMQPAPFHATPPADVKHVIDGGALLHRVGWKKGETYAFLMHQYKKYLTSRYPHSSAIIFDGYSNPSTKDSILQRRYQETSTDVDVQPQHKCDTERERFLSNPTNKSSFIHQLSDTLQPEFGVVIAEQDADLTIVLSALNTAKDKPVIVVADDTDIIVLLLYHFHENHKDVFFKPEPKWTSVKEGRCWDIRLTQQLLGRPLCNNLLLMHALTGSDTTSSLCGIGKTTALHVFSTVEEISVITPIFHSTEPCVESLIQAGKKLLCLLYKDNTGLSLDQLRFLVFCKKVSKSVEAVEPKTLPPTSAAANLHIKRVYHQVQAWLEHKLDPSQWGWIMENGHYKPRMTNLPPGPQELMEAIFCGCKTGCAKGNCKCKKFGLCCIIICLDCRRDCFNAEPFQSESQWIFWESSSLRAQWQYAVVQSLV